MIVSSYKYTNEATKMVVTVAGDGSIRQYHNNDSGRQRFIKLSGSPTQLASRAFNLNRVVDAVGGNLTAPTWLQIYPSNGNPNQIWKIEEAGQVGSGLDGYKLHSIKADGTDMAWDIPYSTASEGNYVQTYPFHGGNNQLWREEQKSVAASVVTSLHNQRVLDVPGFEGGYALIQHFPANGGFNQAWEVDGQPGSPQRLRSVSSGRYLMSSIVTVDDDSIIFQGRGSNSDFQRWTLDLDSSGAGTIKNEGTGHFLSVAPGAASANTMVRGLPEANGAAHQRWQLIG
jgi:hypothetical protein